MIAISYKLMTFNEPATLLKELKMELKPYFIFKVKRVVMMSKQEKYLVFLNSFNLIPDNQFLLPLSVIIAQLTMALMSLLSIIWTGFYRVSCAIIG